MCHAENVEWIDFGELFIDTGFFENMRTLKEKKTFYFKVRRHYRTLK